MTDNIEPEPEHSNYADPEWTTHEFNLLWENTEETSIIVREFVKEWVVRKVPNMTAQTIGINVKRHVTQFFADHPENIHAEVFGRLRLDLVDVEEVGERVRDAFEELL